jgi:hypothetical protein
MLDIYIYIYLCVCVCVCVCVVCVERWMIKNNVIKLWLLALEYES